MAQHIRNQNIRQREHPNGKIEPLKYMFSSQMQRIRSSPKMMMGIIISIILLIALVLAGHYFRYYTLLSFVPQMPLAPSSHLQYFFF
jgi:hypothetical protein